MFEEQLSQTIIAFIQEEGYTPFVQIPHFMGRIDFVGINDYECIVIESKIGKWKNALRQAVRYGYGAEKTYVALPSPTASYVARHFKEKFEQYGIGLIDANETGAIVLIDCRNKAASPIFKQIILNEAHDRLIRSQGRIGEFTRRFKNE